MKKIAVLLLFGLAAGCIVSAILLPSKTETPTVNTDHSNRELTLDNVDVNAYVSLPVFQSMEVSADTLANWNSNSENISDQEIQETGSSEELAAFKILTQTARSAPVAQENMTVISDVTLSKENTFIDQFADIPVCINDNLPKEICDNLIGCKSGDTCTVLGVKSFMDIENIDVTIIVKDIFDIPYPVTDQYMKKNTEYNSFSEFVSTLELDQHTQIQSDIRDKVMENLIPYTMSLATFVEPPEQMIKMEMDILKKDNSQIQYEDARQSLKHILYLKAIIEKYEVMPEIELKERSSQFDSELDDIDGYEKMREKYLSFEQDIMYYLLKTIKITNL